MKINLTEQIGLLAVLVLFFNLAYSQPHTELFLPERWLASAVEARKGTASEILDHRLLSSPFSFGPRMCLGARLAELEIKVLIARLVQDWEISIPAGAPPIGMKEYLFLSPFPEPKFAMKRR